ncbi:MAG TPA: DUF6491 family protein [Steroidobacteraceae bacterium]|jgi:hypothetical protein|nr:DUF6491 family protein [Steroidobacteraceae bacterium]
MTLLKAKTLWLLLAAGAMSAASFSTRADNPPPSSAPEARIPFAKRNIWNWQVVDDKTVLIQDIGRKWYKATLFATCIDLPFAEKIGFDSGPTGTFDKFGAILVRGQRCPLNSLVETTAPPKKSKAKKPEPPAAPK